MKMKRKASLVLTGLLSVGVLMAGCSSNSATTSAKSDSGNSSTVAVKPLTVGAPNGNWQENFNPFVTNPLYGTMGLIYQPLFIYSTVSQDTYPALGTKYAWTNNNKTLEVTLRSGVKWSDGQPFTADDVLFTFNTLKKYPAADTSGMMKVITSVEKKGTDVVDFNFNERNIPFQEYVLQACIVPEHIWKNLGDPSKVTMTKPIGTGPYELESFTQQVYKLKKNNTFYDKASYKVPEIDFKAFNSNESAQLALVNGQLDWASMFIPDVDKVYASKSSDFHYWFPASSTINLYPNLKNSILKDVNVRKAINMAINRDKIAKQAEYGYVQPLNVTAVQPRDKDFIAPQYQGKQFKQDLSGAEKLLQDAGYKKGSDGIYVSPSGKKLSFTLQVVAGWSDWIQTCMLVAQDLKKIGIDVKVEQPQIGAYQANLQSGKFDLAMGWTNPSATPYRTFKDELTKTGGWNPEGWNDPATEQAFNDYKVTTDPAAQKAAMAKIEDVVVNQAPFMPLFYGETWYEYSTKDYTGWPDKDNSYATPAVFSWPQAAVILSKLKPAGK
ncbi:ABC transporter substrate-binding protein [Neobacillus cucumis]|uniref:ABC transporter substrate-binding protein n=1 Tax=Neobacillus cucumis TaxID=1740721 RepID=UPI002E1A2686|nr:ABC transporter substrate-binding protein [Neobacillus cucumis]